MKDFTNLRVFSSYSIFESTVRIEDLINLSRRMNFSAVALCDRMNLFAAVEFSNYAISNGIKPIIGCLLKVDKFGFLPIYIKNKEGYKELSYVLSQYYIRKEPILFLEDLKELRNCICLSGGTDSIFYSSSTDKKTQLIELKKIFANDFYVEIQNLPGKNTLLQLAYELEIPIVITSPVLFLQKNETENLYVLDKIKNNGLYDPVEAVEFSDLYLRSRGDLEQIFRGLEEGFENTIQISKKCSFCFEPTKPLMPTYCKDEDEFLRKLAYEGLKKRLGTKVTQIYIDRLEREISLLELKKFSGYFLLTSDFVKYAKSQEIPVGPGRGSGAGSLVAYVLEITDIDPIKYNLIFERFLNPEREAIPDFDIDYCPEGRKKVIEYIAEKYGTYNVVNIITFGKMQAKAVLRDVCRVFGIPFKQANIITSYIPHDQINPVTLEQAINTIDALKKHSENPKFKKIFDIALKLEGIPRNLSKHAAGVIISDRPVFEVCPLIRDESGELTTQFDLKSSEQVGCVKFDFLGLKTLTIIKRTTDLIEKNHGVKISFSSIPTNDKKTFERICSLDMEGVFQFEKIGVREVIHKMQPNTIEDLIAINALYRPGPIKSIPSYINRKNGKEKIVYPHHSIERILEPTYGIIVYQEQVMDIARVCGGYTLAEADLLRRAMGKKKHSEMIAHRSKFLKGCIKNSIEQRIANSLFDDMVEFSGYGFNKSHAAPYSLISYVCAYLKAHYPLEFLCSALSLEMDEETKMIKFIYNLKALNIKLLPPCVNNSEYNFSIYKDKIRYGIAAIKNVGEKIALEIFKKSPYSSVEDFLAKNKGINKKSWEALVLSGSLDIFKIPRKVMTDNFNSFLKGEYHNSLLSDYKTEYSVFEKYLGEQKAFGFFLFNPFGEIRDLLKVVNCLSIFTLLNGQQKKCYIAGELISFTMRRKINGRKGGTSFAFLEVGDESAIVDITVFENILQKYIQELEVGSLFIIEVMTQREDDFTKLTAASFYSPEEFLSQIPEPLHLNLHNRHEVERLMPFLQKGDREIYMNFEDNQIELKNVKYSLDLLLEANKLRTTL
jgi:DNA polymerase-3 subunit alpha